MEPTYLLLTRGCVHAEERLGRGCGHTKQLCGWVLWDWCRCGGGRAAPIRHRGRRGIGWWDIGRRLPAVVRHDCSTEVGRRNSGVVLVWLHKIRFSSSKKR